MDFKERNIETFKERWKRFNDQLGDTAGMKYFYAIDLEKDDFDIIFVEYYKNKKRDYNIFNIKSIFKKVDFSEWFEQIEEQFINNSYKTKRPNGLSLKLIKETSF